MKFLNFELSTKIASTIPSWSPYSFCFRKELFTLCVVCSERSDLLEMQKDFENRMPFS